jgi:hypothetical protein
MKAPRTVAHVAILVALVTSAIPTPASTPSTPASVQPKVEASADRLGPVALTERAVDGPKLSPTTREVGGRSVDGFVPEVIRPTVSRPARPHEPPSESVRAFTPFFPADFTAPFVVEGSGVRVTIKALGASGTTAQTEQGKIIYRGAYEQTDSVHTVTAARTEEILLLHGPEAPTRFAYEIASVEGAPKVIEHEGGVRFVDERGCGLEIEAPWVVDASGEKRDGAVRWVLGKQRGDGTRLLTLVLDPTGLEYPLAIDPSWTPLGVFGNWWEVYTATLLQNGKVLVAAGLVGGGPSTIASLYDPATGAWSPTGELTHERWMHTATLLRNGKVLVAGGQGPGNAIATRTAELYDPATGTWDSTSFMNVGRAGHTATLLRDGRVLVAGGYEPTAVLIGATAEVYDPVTGTWDQVNDLAYARIEHTATLLSDGEVLVAGGLDPNGTLYRAELFDPTTGFWRSTGSLRYERSDHTATALSDGRVLAAGGTGSSSPTASEIYDPATDRWSSTGSMVEERDEHTATLLPDGTVLVTGGDSSVAVVSSAELYDPGTGQWTATSSLAEHRRGHTATLLPGGTVLVVGGNSPNSSNTAELYDPTVGTWAATGSFATLRAFHTATLLPNGRVLVAGGLGVNGGTAAADIYDPATEQWTAAAGMPHTHVVGTATLLQSGKVLVVGDSAATDLFDPAAGTWAATGSMTESRRAHTATLLTDGRVLVTGGIGGFFNTTSARAEVYDPATGQWRVTSPLATARSSHTATLLPNGKVLVAGGVTTGNVVVGTAELYDPATGTWSAVGNLATARYYHTATLLPNGKVFVAGGYNGASLASTEIYDPAANAWSGSGTLSTARHNHTATLLPNGKVFVAGGRTTGNTLTNTAELYEPSTALWTATANLSTARHSFTATLLPNGKVLVAGGQGSFSVLSSAELFDTGSGFTSSRRPALTSVGTPLLLGDPLNVTGVRFHGKGGGSSGNGLDSSTNYPLAQIRSLGNEQTRFLNVSSTGTWDDTWFLSSPLTDFPPGYALATVFVNGIPSASEILVVTTCPNEVELSAGSYTVNENGGSITVTVTKTGACDASVGYVVTGNTATAGADFTATSGTLSFFGAQTTRTFTITIANDALAEGNEALNVRLINPVDCALGQNRHAAVTILDDDSAGTLQFGATNYNVSEVSATTTISVLRTGGSAGAVSVPWTLLSNIGVTGLDTQGATSGTLNWAAGDSTAKSFTVMSKDDSLVEGNEQMHIFLGTPTGGATLGARSRTNLTVLDNDVPPGNFAFSTQIYTGAETGSATIAITRTGVAAAQSVTFTASNNGTAAAGQDFTFTNVVVNFAVGQSLQTVTVPILTDTLAEGNESINLTLSGPTGGATLASMRRAVLTILDDDASGALEFLTPAYTFDETAGTVTISLTRTGGSAGAVGATVTTSGNLATSGADYQAVTTTVSFAAGVTTASVTVPITNDTQIEGTESLNLTLSSPTGGATLGAGQRAVLVIVDDDMP